jgi:CDP-diacylglycerol--glycerol-3-phosphate 3-phosphatidyltransferase
LFDGRFRAGVDRVTKPVAVALVRTRLSPDHFTAFGLLLAFPTAWAIATGRLGLGLGLLIGTAVPDLLDGALAKASGRSSIRGAFFDSVCDRVSDTLVLGAMSWYLLDTHRHGHIALLPVAALGASLLVSYERAKAEALGFTAKGGLMERAERIIVLCACLAFSFMMIPLLWVLLGLTTLTAIQRFVMVWRQANAAGHGPPPIERRIFVRRAGYESPAVSTRWRAWREANGWVPRADRYSSATQRSTASLRWQERRQTRLARLAQERSEDPSFVGPPRRRSGTRRP